ncbi:MAG TPA: amidase [Xanthobacteraceae bacterium]|jgi:Asp-tRNA(Asn)/Glu-tRNA(Gln) amidotransferase A subunit family amidase|nr:amidase [Xanthobacteraceae bacterium]
MLSALDLARRIESGELTPRAVIELCAEAIAAREIDVRAFVVLDLDGARRAAEAPGLASSPLRGLPVAFKDIFDTADFPTQYGSPIYAGYRPRADSTAVALTRRNGGIVIGKAVTTEMASQVPSVTRNPLNLEHTPGGSSAGSAAAVAAGMVPLAFGTQTAGSVIRPAAFCGTAGFKPSYRLIPMVGVKDVSWHLDTAGLFGAGVADVAFAAGAVLGRDLRVDKAAPSAPHIALTRTHLWPQASLAMQKAVETAARIAESAGAKVSELTLPPMMEEAFAAQITIQDFETFCAETFEYDRHRDKIDYRLREVLDRAASITTEAYDVARRMGSRARRVLADAIADYDVLLTPSAPGVAPHGFETTGNPMFNRLWTLMGLPCVNVPGLSENGLPLGIQIVGRFGRDRQTLEAALFVEQAIKEKIGA